MGEDKLPEDIKQLLNGKKLEDIVIKVLYKNWRGKVSERNIFPLSIFYGKTEFHKEEQWLMKVYDLDKKDYRVYSLKDIQEWINIPIYVVMWGYFHLARKAWEFYENDKNWGS